MPPPVSFARDPNKISLLEADPVPVVWGGEHFGDVNHEQERVRKECCCWEPVIHAAGPATKITYAENVNDRRTDLKIIGTCCLCPCVVGIVCLCASTCYPQEHLFRTKDGETVGHLKLTHHHDVSPCSGMQACLATGSCHSPSTLQNDVHLAGMSTEQRRLALVAALYETAAFYAQQPNQGGGGC